MISLVHHVCLFSFFRKLKKHRQDYAVDIGDVAFHRPDREQDDLDDRRQRYMTNEQQGELQVDPEVDNGGYAAIRIPAANCGGGGVRADVNDGYAYVLANNNSDGDNREEAEEKQKKAEEHPPMPQVAWKH